MRIRITTVARRLERRRKKERKSKSRSATHIVLLNIIVAIAVFAFATTDHVHHHAGIVVVDAFIAASSNIVPTRNVNICSTFSCPNKKSVGKTHQLQVLLVGNNGNCFRKRHCGRRTSTTEKSISYSSYSSSSSLNSSLRNDNNNVDDNDNDNGNENTPIATTAIFLRRLFFSFPSFMALWLPLFAIQGIPSLVSYARSFPPNSSEQFAVVTLLIVSNRIYLYALALTIVGVSAVRSATTASDPSSLGQRLTALTEELLVLDKPLRVVDGTKSAATTTTTIEEEGETTETTPVTTTTAPPSSPPPPPSFIQKLVDDSGLEENLDGVDSGTQALLLPLLVSGLLAASVVSLPFWSSDGLPTTDVADNELLQQLQNIIKDVIPFVSQAWNAILLTLFTRSELRRLGYELFGIGSSSNAPINGSKTIIPTTITKPQIVVECVLALAITGYGAYFLQYWPACNFVNMAIAILVARSIQLNSFRSIVGALALLTLYDGASVFLIPAAANAIDATITDNVAAASSSFSSTTLFADASASASAMGSVAIQKLTSTSFQPGLLVTKLDGDKLTGTLGLGDAVFPSILASFLKRFDDDHHGDDRGERKNAATATATATATGYDDDDDVYDECIDTRKPPLPSLFVASLIGYAVGCAACEFAPTISTGGVPALVFLLPSMSIATILTAVASGQFHDLWKYERQQG